MKLLSVVVVGLSALAVFKANAGLVEKHEVQLREKVRDWMLTAELSALKQDDWFSYSKKPSDAQPSNSVEYIDMDLKMGDELFFSFYTKHNNLGTLFHLSFYQTEKGFHVRPTRHYFAPKMDARINSNERLFLQELDFLEPITPSPTGYSDALFRKRGNKMETVHFTAFWGQAKTMGLAIGVDPTISDSDIATFYVYFRTPDTDEIHASENPEMNAFAWNPVAYPKEKLKGKIIRLHCKLD